MLGLGGVGGAGGGEGGGVPSSRELSELQEKLRINESLMHEMTLTWEQKVQATEKIHQVLYIVHGIHDHCREGLTALWV